ncbi:MAG: tyrosinase family protein [Micropruina sp.]|nr:tyrosinase family protein [Micropruina sp.]
MKCRKNVADLTSAEKAELVQAFLDLKDPVKSPSKIPAAATRVTNGGGTPNRYDDYVWLHNTVSVGAHRGPAFGPWHREFLHQFEFDLQQVSGNPHLTLPYWDWTSARTSAHPGWPFTNDLLGGFGSAGPGATTGIVTSGPFANSATWRMNIRRATDSDLTLKRSNGIPDGTELPTRDDARLGLGVGVAPGDTWPSTYDGVPWNDYNVTPTSAQVLASFRKYLERVLHDFVHVWIGGAWEFTPQGNPGDGGHMTFPAVAVNDPVFWFHHCNVDRLWSIWQRKSGTPGYLPQVAATAEAGHNGDDVMASFATPSWFNAPQFERPNDNQDHHDQGYWYHTDLPELTLDTPSVTFGSVPELLTTYQPVLFTVRTCQPVRFALTGVTGTNFGIPAGQGIVVVDHDDDSDTVTARVYVQFQANGAVGVPQAGSATIRAYLIDSDGFDAAQPRRPVHPEHLDGQPVGNPGHPAAGSGVAGPGPVGLHVGGRRGGRHQTRPAEGVPGGGTRCDAPDRRGGRGHLRRPHHSAGRDHPDGLGADHTRLRPGPAGVGDRLGRPRPSGYDRDRAGHDRRRGDSRRRTDDRRHPLPAVRALRDDRRQPEPDPRRDRPDGHHRDRSVRGRAVRDRAGGCGRGQRRRPHLDLEVHADHRGRHRCRTPLPADEVLHPDPGRDHPHRDRRRS